MFSLSLTHSLYLTLSLTRNLSLPPSLPPSLTLSSLAPLHNSVFPSLSLSLSLCPVSFPLFFSPPPLMSLSSIVHFFSLSLSFLGSFTMYIVHVQCTCTCTCTCIYMYMYIHACMYTHSPPFPPCPLPLFISPGNIKLVSLSGAVKLAAVGNIQIPGTVIQMIRKYCKVSL